MYNPQKIEKKWQNYWEVNKVFHCHIDHSKEKFYCLDMFPYPSGSGLHVGHLEGYTATDILCRYKRMRGFNVLHTMGWDAFGLPAEQFAIKNNIHPRSTTKKNIAKFKSQIKSLGFSYDWDREINTTEPKYYKWTQWIFLQLYKNNLAFQDKVPVNWCPKMKAVLAHEEVENGLSVEGNYPVVQLPLRQWMLKITKYADRLLNDLQGVDWPRSIVEMQKHWIGKSVGAEIIFSIQDAKSFFEVYTTRPDTIFGATFCVLAPEHPLCKEIVSVEQKKDVEEYITQCLKKSELERIGMKEKSGIFSGAYAINPATETAIPIWIADYVLYNYGKGAIMAVPAHDERDYAFAQKYQLPIKEVVTGGNIVQEAYCGEGNIINSEYLNGLYSQEARDTAINELQKNDKAKKTITYKIRDWVFSRQRYWGEPIPILLDENMQTYPLDEKELPLKLPETEKFLPTANGESPLAHIKTWLTVEKQGKKYQRESNTMPQWAGSCWYYLRYLDPQNENELVSQEAEKYWMPVDLYVGGAEHAVLHLLYARFWHKFLYDIGVVSTKEPFLKLINQGIILGSDGVKMSKSRGNVVNPDKILDEYGADAIRLYEMFLGPLEKSKPWDERGIEGVFRFLHKLWKNITVAEQPHPSIEARSLTDEEQRHLHITIKKVTLDIERLSFNTAISELMIMCNYFATLKSKPLFFIKQFILLLSPFAPHVAEELWQILGEKESLSYHSWPQYDEKYCKSPTYTLPIQINGKLRHTIEIENEINEAELMNILQQEKKLYSYISGKNIRKVIYRKGKICNLII